VGSYAAGVGDLWSGERARRVTAAEPLAVRMRPRSLEEVAGQGHVLGPGKLLRRMVESGVMTSVLLYGPPGTGKTTLAEVMARATGRHFERENAAGVGVARVREILEGAKRRLGEEGKKTVLFLDEIHRFSRAQQDVLLGDVERGVIGLIGATTENPLFAVNSALVSRSTLFRLEPLSVEEIKQVLRRAIADRERGFGAMALEVEEAALEVWAVKSDGDARRALTALEVAVLSGGREQGTEGSRDQERKGSRERGIEGSSLGPSVPGSLDPFPLRIDRAAAEDSIQQKAAVYDGTGDEHYDAASALIKSVRGSDPDAAVYWLARMLEAGEDPRFIARRLAILASEDIGNADPRGIMVAAAAWELCERVGMPECRITLSQCAIYLALAPKSNASYAAIEAALEDVREGRTLPVPVHIKDGNVRKAGQMGGAEKGVGGVGYAYTHEQGAASAELGRVGTQDYLGVAKRYYEPGEAGFEKQLKERVEEVRRVREEGRRNAGQ
jgi:putative ATPase